MTGPVLLTLSHDEGDWLLSLLDSYKAQGMEREELPGVHRKLCRQMSRVEQEVAGDA